MTRPVVSTVVRRYRLADPLPQCVSSIRGQTYGDLEVLTTTVAAGAVMVNAPYSARVLATLVPTRRVPARVERGLHALGLAPREDAPGGRG